MIALLDANVLIALVISEHVHHEPAREWWAAHDGPYATCPITQGALVRTVVRNGGSIDESAALLTSLDEDQHHQFWSDDVRYGAVRMRGVIGHRQVTDAYLAQLARHRGGRLATFDRGLAALHADVATLVSAA